MSEQNTKHPSQLRTLERWRSVELDGAKAEYLQALKVRVDRESRVEDVASQIADMQQLAREAMKSNGHLSAEKLQRLAAYASQQEEEMAEAQSALQVSVEASEKARISVVERLERLSAVQRLSERRNLEADREYRRKDQKRLDEQALSRLSADAAELKKSRTED